MSILQSNLLRTALLVDAAASGATGVLCAAGVVVLSPLLGLPEPLLRIIGLLLLPYAALVAFLGTRAAPHPIFVWAVIGGNVVYAVDCLGLIVGPGVSPTGLGVAFLVVQALVVLILAECQFLGLRKNSAPMPMAA